MVKFSHNKVAKKKQNEKQNNTCVLISFANELIFPNRNDYQNLFMDKINTCISVHADSAQPSCFGRARLTDLTTLSWKMEYVEYSGRDVHVHLFSVLTVQSK